MRSIYAQTPTTTVVTVRAESDGSRNTSQSERGNLSQRLFVVVCFRRGDTSHSVRLHCDRAVVTSLVGHISQRQSSRNVF